jgi:hypothetical protein
MLKMGGGDDGGVNVEGNVSSNNVSSNNVSSNNVSNNVSQITGGRR